MRDMIVLSLPDSDGEAAWFRKERRVS